MSSSSAISQVQEDQYYLSFNAVTPESADLDGAFTSFNASLENRIAGRVGLAGISGILIDLDKAEGKSFCVTINEALKRHTSPKRITVSSDAEARADLDGGTDGRIQARTSYALYLWLPEILNESEGVGIRLLSALQEFLGLRDASVLIDFGVGHEDKEEDEEYGFVEIFYPELDQLDLEVSECGQFATGVWSNTTLKKRKSKDVGFVHL